MRLDTQRDYWDSLSGSVKFTHPLDWATLTRLVPKDARVLDLGCGYGRTLKELKQLGYSNLMGMDISTGMLDRARSHLPKTPLLEIESIPSPLPDNSFDCILLFSVLSCQIADADQERLMTEVERLLKPESIVYIADFPIQDDDERRERYDAFREKYANYGTFELDDGGIIRHLDLIRFRELTGRFEQLSFKTIALNTMRGNAATGFQYFGRLN